MSKSPSIQQQADFLHYLRLRCTMRDGSIAAETSLLLKAEDVEALETLRLRLERIAPFEMYIAAGRDHDRARPRHAVDVDRPRLDDDRTGAARAIDGVGGHEFEDT